MSSEAFFDNNINSYRHFSRDHEVESLVEWLLRTGKAFKLIMMKDEWTPASKEITTGATCNYSEVFRHFTLCLLLFLLIFFFRWPLVQCVLRFCLRLEAYVWQRKSVLGNVTKEKRHLFCENRTHYFLAWRCRFFNS